MKYKGIVKVSSIEWLLPDVYKIKVDIPEKFQIKPGQFFMIKNNSSYPLLNRPISVSNFDGNNIEFGIKKVGVETKNIGKLKKGDSLYLLGPLGRGFEIKKTYNKVLVIGGGIGIEPLKFLLKDLKNNKIDTKTLLGFKNEIYDSKDFEKYSNNIEFYSENKIKNINTGYPTDNLKEVLLKDSYDAVFSCGPEPLMKKVQEITNELNIESQLLLEEKMACGIGACLGCTCKTNDGLKKVCSDGPMFYGSEVQFNE